MGFNLGSAYSTGVSGAAAGLSAGPWGALAGGVAGLIGGGLSGGSDSSSATGMNINDLYTLEMYNTIKDLFFMHEQNRYNVSNMRYQTDLQRELQEQQFGHNKWFVQNAYQNSVQDLRKAGLNPLLATQNGGSSGSVSGGSASALGLSQFNKGIDLASYLSASANSAQAKIAKQQLALNSLATAGQLYANYANSSKALEEAKTEETERALNDAKSLLTLTQEKRERIHKDLDKKYGDKDRLLAQEATINGIEVNTLNALNNKVQANASLTSAGASVTSSKALAANQDADTRIKKARAEWIEKHPYQYGFQQTLEALGSVGLMGIGVGLTKGHEAYKKNQANKAKASSSVKKVGKQYMNNSFR